ncbi:UPF0182 protein [Microbispora rosea subsp. aerata]|nr:UPF0182 family protein [Microbispora rosea]GGO25674.1 UPF0182 protein [Microbispora rosea subsp. aerata]GIH56895.1 UPF0182 protein [Microbispora rosea subsp. aerata]GLJ82821.1 UPF0182 protein [Microbispora rosea subsp. aerata]
MLIAVVALVVLLLLFSGIYTDYLWYDSVNFSSVFSTMLLTQVLLFVVGAALMIAIVGGNMVLAHRTRPMFGPGMFGAPQGADRYRVALDPHRRLVFLVGMGVLALFTGSSTAGQWKIWLQFVNRTPFGQKDAQFGLDLSFFMFTYPFLRLLLNFLFTAVILSIVAATIVHYVYGGFRISTPGGVHATRAARTHLSVLLGTFVLLKALAYWLDMYGLVFSERGKTFGASYTDVHAVLPAKGILAVISLICALIFFAGVIRPGGMFPGVAFGLLVLSAVLIGTVYPSLVEQFQVKPNQQSKEQPYIQRNIDATRKAYGVDTAKVTEYSAKTDTDPSVLQGEASAIPGMRLLDPSLLSPTFQQKQQIRGYYRFPDQLDIDRYPVDGKLRDTVVAVREIGRPPEGQRNWINDHLVYTHGFGFVAAPGNKVDSSGLPEFSERDIPPVGDLGKYEPRIYFGENSPDYSIVGGPKTAKPIELDYPQQGQPGTDQGNSTGQVNNTYQGKGGVPIGNFFRRLLYAVKYGETNLLLNSNINSESRILYIREPAARIQQVAPFLTLDRDPYPAVVDGRIVWIVDAYTTSDSYPYSERKSLESLTTDVQTSRLGVPQVPRDEINYIRNSVKATVDAYDGTVTLYAWDETDPVLKTWQKAFGGVVKPASEISQALRSHLRYPADLFKAQREILTSYHVTDANAFFSGQDFWKVPEDPATQKSKQPPYYVTMKMPGSDTERFSLTTTFVPNQRQNMAAFMAVDATATTPNPPLEILQLPSTTAIQGPPQAQNLFESNPEVSKDLNLLRGTSGATDVLYGNLLTLPFGNGLLYVEPVYIQPRAESSGKYPTLRKILVLYGEKVGFGDNLSEALQQVFGGTAATPPEQTPEQTSNQPPGQVTPPESSSALTSALDRAQQAYDDSQKALSANPPDWKAYGDAQAALKKALDDLAKLKDTAPAPTASPAPSGSPSESPSPGGSPPASATPSPTPSG